MKQISDLEDKKAETIQSEQKKRKRIKKNENGIRRFWDNLKYNNICNMGIPEGEERQQEIENLFEKKNDGKLP